MTTEIQPTIDELRSELASILQGEVFDAGSDGYADGTGGFNLLAAHRPDLAVVPLDADDIAATVRFAAAHGMPVMVQATGHGAHEPFVGGVLISTGHLKQARLDADRRIVTVGPGTKWSDVFELATPHGLAGLCGSTSDVGVIGYTLGGGLPVLGRAQGFAAEYVRSMEVVTGDGAVRQVDVDQDPELFWALRGGGAGLGIVTSMTFELQQIGEIYGGGLFFDGAEAEAVLRAYAEWSASVPDQMCSSLAFLRLPPFPEIPEPLRGRFAMHLRIAYAGDSDEGERLIAPLRACAPVMMDSVQTMPYAALDSIHMDPPTPTPFREAGALLAELTPAVRDVLLAEAGPESACPFLLVELRHLGGRLGTPSDSDCIGGRDAAFHVLAVDVPHGDASSPAALDGFRTALAPHVDGYFVNLKGNPADGVRREDCWSVEQYGRLERARAQFDPSGVLVG